MFCIYAFLLNDNKYYIEKTKNKNLKIENFDLNKTIWIQKYKLIKILEIFDKCDEYDEDKITLKYMGKYGIDNVRGGSFCQENLSEQDKMFINKMIKNAKNKCFNCGESEHFDNNNHQNDSKEKEINNKFKKYKIDRDLYDLSMLYIQNSSIKYPEIKIGFCTSCESYVAVKNTYFSGENRYLCIFCKNKCDYKTFL